MSILMLHFKGGAIRLPLVRMVQVGLVQMECLGTWLCSRM